jgi:hypothetical protein
MQVFIKTLEVSLGEGQAPYSAAPLALPAAAASFEMIAPALIHAYAFDGSSFCIAQGNTITLEVDGADIVGRVKELIAGKEHIPAEHQRLVFGGRPLEDEEVLAHYGIGNESTLHLVRLVVVSGSIHACRPLLAYHRAAAHGSPV